MMKLMKWLRAEESVLAVLIMAIALGSCGTEPEVDEQLIEDAALLAADATLEDVQLWGQSFSGGAPAAAPAQAMPGEPGGRRGFFGSFSGTRSVAFFDENGEEMESYDPLLTESIEIEHEIEGEVSRGSWTATVHRERNKVVSGLLGEETHRTWNGTGASEVTRSQHLDDVAARTYEAIGAVEYDDVVVPIPGSDSRWPISGSITRELTITRTGPEGERTRTVVVVITFDGSSTAMATVNGEPVEIDLAAHDGRNPVRMVRRDG